MKQILMLGKILLFLSLLPCGSWAQNVIWGPLIPEKNRVEVTDVLSVQPSGVTVLKAKVPALFVYRYSDYQIQRLDAKFNPGLETNLAPKYEDKDLEIEFAFSFKGNQYVFTSFANAKLDKKFLFAQKVNAKTLTLEGKLTKVAELTYSKMYATGNFGYTFSRDSSKLMIYANSEMRKNEPEKYSITILDQDLNTLWQMSVTLPYAENKFLVTDFAVDGRGGAYILGGKTERKGLTLRQTAPNYQFKILSYTAEGEQVDEYDVSFGSNFITDLQVDVSPERDIICAGFYSKKGTFSIDGSYYMRIDRATKEVAKLSANEFGLDFLTMHMTERQEEKAERKEAKGKDLEMYEYDLRKLIPRADGGAVLVAEQYFVRVVTIYDARTGTARNTYHYYYNDIIVVSISSEGDIEWATKVPKRQHSVNDRGFFSSFVTMVTDGKLYFIYNDNMKNYEKDLEQGRFYNFNVGDKNGVVVLASVDSEGKVSRDVLIKNTEIEAITRPKLCRQVSGDQLLLYAKRSSGIQFGMVKF